jgi:hypothetical protein
MEKSRIRDGKKADPASGINIPDPKHCLTGWEQIGRKKEGVKEKEKDVIQPL